MIIYILHGHGLDGLTDQLHRSSLSRQHGSMPQLPVLDKRTTDGGISDGDMAEPKKTPFKLSQLDLGSIGVGEANPKRSGSRKRAAISSALDDDEDPLEEAQVDTSTVVCLRGPHYQLMMRNLTECLAEFCRFV